MLHEVFDFGTILIGQTVSGGVGDIDHGGSCLDDRLDDPGQILVVGASGILGIEFHIIDVFLGILHGSHRPFDNLLTGGVELVPDMRVAGANARVYTLVLGIFQRLSRQVDVVLHRPGECAYRGPCHRLGDFDDRVEITWAGNGEPRLYHVHPKLFELSGHLDFLYRVELTPRHLLTIAKCGVEKKQSFVHFINV